MAEKNDFYYMDLDADSRKMGKGSTRKNVNCRLNFSDSLDAGVVRNVRSNEEIITDLLPEGINTCVNYFKDTVGQSLIYFISNSLGNHCILRFYEATQVITKVYQDTSLDFSTTHPVKDVNLIDDLLFWNDAFGSPKKINLTKASDVGHISHIYFGNGSVNVFTPGTSFTLQVDDESIVMTKVYTVSTDKTFAENLEDIKVSLNAWFVLNSIYITAEVVDFLYIKLNTYMPLLSPPPYYLVTMSASNGLAWVSDVGFYPKVSDPKMYIEVIKYPPAHPPKLKRGLDSTRNSNLLKGVVTQFAFRYYYDDNEISALSPFSLIALDDYSTGGDMLRSNNNYIRIDYTDNSRLSDRRYRSMINKVEILVRYGNTGLWQSIKVLNRYELTGYYDFYNDGFYSSVALDEVNEPYDAVPLVAGAQEIANNRLFYADYTEGYDEVPVDIEPDPQFKDEPKTQMWKIRGRLVYMNIHKDAASNQKFMPAFTVGDTMYWGSNGWGDQADRAARFKQFLPSKGIPVYLAGTPYYAITKQANIYMTPNPAWAPGGQVFYSEFEIEVPAGEYILRAASHLCDKEGTHGSIYSLNDPNLSWQNTSTYLVNIFGDGGEKYERRIALPEVDPDGTYIYDLQAKAALEGVGYDGCIIVADLTWYKFTGGTDPDEEGGSVCGYLVEDTTEQNTKARMAGALRMEYQEMEFTIGNPGSVIAHTFTQFTDHNGFFWYCARRYDVAGIAVTIQAKNPSGIIKAYSDTFYEHSIAAPDGLISPVIGGGITPNPYMYVGDYLHESVIYATNFTLCKGIRTSIKGNLIDPSGSPIAGIYVLYTHTGRLLKTDTFGDFSIAAYDRADQVGTGRTIDYLIINHSLLSLALNISSFDAEVGGTFDYDTPFYANPNNNGSVFPVVPFELPFEIFSPSSLKRGGLVQVGIEYADDGGRITTVCTNEKAVIYLPFFTEDLHKYYPNRYPSGTYITGQPIIRLIINHLPPKTATTYRLVRSIDLVYKSKLQLAICSAEYVTRFDPNGDTPLSVTSYASGTADLIFLDLATLEYTKELDPDFMPAYTYSVGDRLRILRKSNGDFFQEFFDVEIKGDYGQKIIIDNILSMPELSTGCIVEVYTPRFASEEKFFYGIGEVHEIIRDGNNVYHAGSIQDQTSAQPAIIEFTHGDTYYRKRDMRVIDRSTDPANNSPVLVSRNVETENISDFYDSTSCDIGRPNIVNKDFKQKRYFDSGRFSEKYFSGTRTNGLSNFKQLNHFSTKDKSLGAITKLVMMNQAMLIIQEYGEATAYIETNVVIDADNKQIFQYSDKVVNEVRPLLGEHGCVDPRTVQRYGSGVYYFSKNKGVVIRYSNDGLTPISNYHAKSLFAALADEIKRSTGITDYNTCAVFDPHYDEYVITIAYKKEGVDKSITIAFNELINKWVTFYSFAPEMYGVLGRFIYSFKGGKLYRHDTGVGYGNFYGVQHKQEFRPVFADGFMKIYNNMIIIGNKKWDIPRINVSGDDLNPDGMLSELIETDFDSQEGTHSAVFLRNKNTPNIADPLFEGDELKGFSIELEMENEHTDAVSVFGVQVNFIESYYLPGK